MTLDELREVTFFREAERRIRARHGNLTSLNFQPTVVRALVDWQVTDLLDNTQTNLRQRAIASVDDVRRCPELLAEPGAEVAKLKRELELFLRERVYRHHRVSRMVRKGQRMIQRMFDELIAHRSSSLGVIIGRSKRLGAWNVRYATIWPA